MPQLMLSADFPKGRTPQLDRLKLIGFGQGDSFLFWQSSDNHQPRVFQVGPKGELEQLCLLPGTGVWAALKGAIDIANDGSRIWALADSQDVILEFALGGSATSSKRGLPKGCQVGTYARFADRPPTAVVGFDLQTRRIHAVELNKGEELWQYPAKPPIVFTLSNKSTQLALAETDAQNNSQITLANTDNPASQQRSLLSCKPLGAFALAFSPDAQRLSIAHTAGLRVQYLAEDSGLDLHWRPDQEGLREGIQDIADAVAPNGPRAKLLMDSIYQTRLAEYENRALMTAWSPDSSLVAAACADGVARIWSLEDAKLLHELPDRSGMIWDLRFDNAGRRIATTNGRNRVKVWDLA